MPGDSKDFQINITTTAQGDGADKAAAGLEKAAAATEKLADASKKVEQPKFFDESKIEAMEKAAEAAAKMAGEEEHVAEKSEISEKKVTKLIGALSQLTAAAAGEGGAEKGLEKLAHMFAAGAFATGNVAVGVLITSVMDLWKAFSGGHGDHEKHIENLKKQAAESEKTAEAVHKLADRAKEFDAAQHDSGHWFDQQKEKIQALFKATETAIDRMIRLKSLMATTEKDRIKLDEEQGKISHEEAAKQIAAVESKAAAEKFADESRKIALRANEIDAEQTALRSKSQQSHREQIEAEQRAKAAQDIADARKSNAENAALTETENKRFKEEQQKIRELEANSETADPESHASNQRYHDRIMQQIADENALKNQKASEAVKRFGNLLPDDKSKPEDYAAKAEAAREKNVAEQRKIAEAQDKLANETAELIKKQKANLRDEQERQKQRDIITERDTDAGRKKDQQEAEAKRKKAQEDFRKPIAEAQKDERQAEQGVKKAASDIERLIGLLEHNPDFQRSPVAQANKRELEEAAQKLKVDPQNASALKQITTTLHKFAPAQDSAAAANIAALEKAVAAIEAWKQKVQELTARIESLEAEATAE